MRRFVAPAVIAAVLTASPLAFAADSATGVIKSMDSKAHTITLDNGVTYQLPANFQPMLRTGEKVKVSWEMKNGKHQADSVVIQK